MPGTRQHKKEAIVLFLPPAVSLLPCTGNGGNEAHPPIRKVRGLTPPMQEADEDNFPLWDTDHDKELEITLSKNRKSRQQLRDEIKTLTSTGDALRQHVKNQMTSISFMENEKKRLWYQCRQFAALVENLPSGMVNDAMDAAFPFSFTKVYFNEAMLEHVLKELRET
jgi:hypothetical protein